MFTRKLLPVLMLGIASLTFTACNSEDPKDTPSEAVDFTKGEFKQKVLIEDITSVSCMWCPLGSFAIAELDKSEYKDRVVGVGVHGDFNAQSLKDPYVLSGINNLMKAVNLKGWPHLSWNRTKTIQGTAFQSFIPKKNNGTEVQYTFDANLFKNFYTKNKLFNEGSPIGIKIESNLTATSGKVDVSLKFGQNINQELKYLVYVLEDGLVYPQANATSLYGNNTGEPIWSKEFVHDHVVRATNNFLGESIAAGETVSSKEFKASANLTYTMQDIKNASVVVAVLDKDGNVLNAQKAKANSTQDYEKK